MKITVRTLTETDLEAVIEDVDHAFVNALRRTLIADVPKLAIEEVTIYDNTSALFDEMLTHRLGLLPVPTDLAAFNFRDECVCEGEGCPNCTVLFTISKEGPGLVVSGDLTPVEPRFAVPDPNIALVRLLEGQRVMLEAAAVLGRGRNHAKWQAVTIAAYEEMPHVQVKAGTTFSNETLDRIRKNVPSDAVTVEGNSIKILNEEKAFKYLRAMRAVADLDAVVFTRDPTKFIFRIETDGSHHPKNALRHAVEILMEKLKGVEELAKLKVEA